MIKQFLKFNKGEFKMRNVIVELKIKLLIKMDDESQLDDIINELDYSFTDTTENANVQDTEIIDYELIDSK